VIGNILFRWEIIGGAHGVDPRTGHHFDALDVAPEALAMVYKLNARRGVRGLPVLVTAPARLPMDAARDAAETRRNP
jgi:hypothetical protein